MNKMVYIVLRNADFTEGRGPMLFDSVWDNANEAVKYAESLEPYKAKMIVGKYSTSYAYGQFIEIQSAPVMSSFTSMKEIKEAEEVRKALAKLTEREKILVGLVKP